MKTLSNRVRKNGSIAASITQSKSGAPPADKSSGREPVPIVFYAGNSAEKLAQIDVPAQTFEVLQRWARWEHRSVGSMFAEAIQVMITGSEEDWNQGNTDNETGPIIPQTKAGLPETFIPSQLCEQTQAALFDLEDAVGAALALAVMNADFIQSAIPVYAGWENLEVGAYQIGAAKIAPLLEARLKAGMEKFKSDLAILAAKIRHVTDLITALTVDEISPEKFAELKGREGQEEVENAISGLQYFLDLQGDVIGRRQVGGAWCCAHSLIQTLDAAQDRASELFRKIKFAVITVEKANAALPQAA